MRHGKERTRLPREYRVPCADGEDLLHRVDAVQVIPILVQADVRIEIAKAHTQRRCGRGGHDNTPAS